MVAAQDCCGGSCAAPVTRDAAWHRAARWARCLAWVSLVWMLAEGAIGLWQGVAAGSIALIGWALGSVVEGMASVIVVWRFTGDRTVSETAERTAQKLVAVSFWLIAPYVAVESVRDLLGEHRSETTALGIVVTALSLVAMPLLGRAKHHLAARLDSAATAGEGTQNYLCAIQAAAVLVSLALTAVWSGGWWFDSIVGLGVAGAAVWQGVRSWRGDDCC
ncbi:cation transporter [Nocardia miyunensis]|uniref:cation transporter n=1 Tax=Nocardia miyunensis TaxID=282684 RepID=UPI00082BA572|nr:cation transporter [Nocardia miyunensis]